MRQTLSLSDDLEARPEARASSWAEARLRLGQANVGFWVLTAVAVVFAVPDLPVRPVGVELLLWAGFASAYALVQAPFDWIGGWSLPAAHGRAPTSKALWLQSWARGVAIHWGAWVAVGWVAVALTAVAGTWLAGAAMVGAGALLVAVQGTLVRWIAGTERVPLAERTRSALVWAAVDPSREDVLPVDDRAFVGGWVGPRGMERLLLPERWQTHMPESVLEVAVLRRQVALHSGSRALGVVAAGAFNTVGLVLVLAALPGAGTGSAIELLVTSAGFTLWSFLGLLSLPTVSRGAVLAVDRAAADLRGDPQAVERAVELLDRDQEDERERPAWVEAIFHPVPSPAVRLDALRSAGPRERRAAYRVARMALFTSWAQLSWLSRAVHCNCGRPVLWALPPGD